MGSVGRPHPAHHCISPDEPSALEECGELRLERRHAAGQPQQLHRDLSRQATGRRPLRRDVAQPAVWHEERVGRRLRRQPDHFQNSRNSPYRGTSSVDPFDPSPGLFVNLAGTTARLRSKTDQYALFLEDRLSVTDRLALVGGLRHGGRSGRQSDLAVPCPEGFRPVHRPPDRSGRQAVLPGGTHGRSPHTTSSRTSC